MIKTIKASVLATFVWVLSISGAFAQYVTTVVSDGCIVTAGYEVPPDKVYDIDVGEIVWEQEELPSFQPRSVIDAIIPSLASSVIENLFQAGENYIKRKATDVTLEYDTVFSTSLYETTKVEPHADEGKRRLPFRLNQRLRCFTIVMSDYAVALSSNEVETQEIFESSTWQPKWDKQGPPKVELYKRLSAAGVDLVNSKGRNEQPQIVFETLLVFSQDGTAVRFVPRYFRAFKFSNRGSKATRSLALNITLDTPVKSAGGNSQQVLLKNFTVKDVEVSHIDDRQTIGRLETEFGFGPESVGAIFLKDEWLEFTPPDYKTSEYVKAIASSARFNEYAGRIFGGEGSDLKLKLEPLNVRTKLLVKEEASELAKFLARFIEENSVTASLSSAVIQELGLITDSEKKEQALQKLKDELGRYQFWQTKYVQEFDNVPEEPDPLVVKEYQESIDEIQSSIDAIEQGCDPLGVVGPKCG